MPYAQPELLAEPDWLAEHADDPQVRIIDCATLEAYRRAHIPGAVHLPVHYYIKEQGEREGGAGMYRDAAGRVRRAHGQPWGRRRHDRRDV